MVSSGKTSPSLQANSRRRRRGHCMMEIAVLLLLLLLYMPVNAGVAVRPAQRPQTDVLSAVNSVRKTQFVPLEDAHKGTQSTASDSRTTDTTQHQHTVPTLLKNILTKSISARSRRAVQKGCQFGTCQVHNLANTLYMMGKSNGKDQSKKAGDPNGYGR